MRIRRSLALTLAVTVALLAAGCGSPDASTPPAATATATATPGGSGAPSPSPSGPAPPGQVTVAYITTLVGQQYAAQHAGVSVALTCDRHGSFTPIPGDKFSCAFNDSKGHSGTIDIIISSTDGSFGWHLR